MLKQSLTPQEMQMIERVAQKINQLGLQTPTLFMLDAGRPLAFLSGQLFWIVQPAASLFVSADIVRQWASLLENPATLTVLKERLE